MLGEGKPKEQGWHRWRLKLRDEAGRGVRGRHKRRREQWAEPGLSDEAWSFGDPGRRLLPLPAVQLRLSKPQASYLRPTKHQLHALLL
jgi:hypothetical protein